MKIVSAKRLRGDIKLPGDKSISHRAAILLALADGDARIENFAESLDCVSTLRCLSALGVGIERRNSVVTIRGVGKRGFSAPREALDCGNSGTTMRLLAGLLAGQSFESVLTGDESLSMRPMKRIIDPLRRMNAGIEADEYRAPLKINGRNPLSAIEYHLPVASAQVKSCILLAGLFADGTSQVISPVCESRAPVSRDHTELMLEYLGAGIAQDFLATENGFAHRVAIGGDSRLSARDMQIPGDISSAAFFMTAAACLDGSDISLTDVGLNPTRTAIIDVLRRFGSEISVADYRKVCGELVGDLRVSGSAGHAANGKSNIISGKIVANLIDEIPVLAVFGTRVEGGLEIRGAEELRVKESDRIAATVENLRRMNADVEEFSDGMRVGRSELKGASVDSFGDHRIAMAFAVAGLLASGETEIVGSDCAAISYPAFFEEMARLVE